MTGKQAPYGTWTSPLTADKLFAKSIAFGDVVIDPLTNVTYHIESRPSEAGRNVLVNTLTGKDIVPEGFNVRSSCHEYGGAAAVAHGGVIYFSNFIDNRVYKVKEGEKPEPVTPENKVHRFAAFVVHPIQTHLLVAVFEDHTNDLPSEIVNTLCVIDTLSSHVSNLVSGADFYACPTFAPNGKRLAWQLWNHPDMPWEGCEVWAAEVELNGSTLNALNPVHVAGKKLEISVGYPQWITNNQLLFMSDESGYQNPHLYTPGSEAKPVFSTPIKEDFAEPAWVFGMWSFAPLDSEGHRVLFSAMRDGRNVLYVASLNDGRPPLEIASPYVVVRYVRQSHIGKPEVIFVGTTTKAPQEILHLTLSASLEPTVTVLKSASSGPSASSDDACLPTPRPITLKVPPNNDPLHVVYYAPTNPEYSGSNLDGEKPPCVLNVHGGPTGLTSQGADKKKAYFTSRGWGWLDVNYGGSSGYGRAYTARLSGTWGEVDVEDCIQAAKILASPNYNLIDPSRTVIRGGSAGGYTVLAALTIGSDLKAFAAATSSYGISDFRKLAEDTHKFESKYLFKLVGGFSEEVFDKRSPVKHAEKIVIPLLVLQGGLDKVVPPEQAEAIVKSIKDRGGQVEYKVYDNEGHGWRQEANLVDSLEREIGFYNEVLRLKA